MVAFHTFRGSTFIEVGVTFNQMQVLRVILKSGENKENSQSLQNESKNAKSEQSVFSKGSAHREVLKKKLDEVSG